ncbi:MAG: beta-galactosidase [Phycisphaeraceae bacterium]|nr:beta-galactosidase [Phycisphaeraceae bacterium]
MRKEKTDVSSHGHDSNSIFGAEVQYFRLDHRYWDEVLDRFCDAGLSCVTTYVQWLTHLVGEPDAKHPAGVLDFEGRTNPRLNLLKFLDLVERRGLKLNFRCGPFCCNEMIWGGYPSWLVNGDPNIMCWDYTNRPTQGYWIGKREGMQPSYLHPTYLAWCDKWLAEIDKIIAPRTLGKGRFISMINLDNEISYICKDSMLDSDYNPIMVKPGGFYHQFLKERYGSTKAVSDAYGVKYASIEAVEPPRSVPAELGRDLAWHTDWMEFKTWIMCRYIEKLRAMHEAHGVKGVTFMTNFNPHRPEGIPTRMPEFQKAVGKGGIVGYDFYRGSFMSYSGYHSMARVLKLMNASLPYTWSAEFMSGTWQKDLTKGGRISDDHMQFMARCALSHGCKSIAWFMFHDRDCWGDSPSSSHGHARPSLNVLRDTFAMVKDKIKGWDSLVPAGDVAVIYDLVQHLHTGVGDPNPCADNSAHVGAPTICGVQAGVASREYEGLFRLVEQAGAQANAVDVMHDASLLMNYPLAMLPGSPVVERQVDKALKQFVSAGGTLLVSGAWPAVDEHGKSIKFLGLSAVKAGSVKLGKGAVIWHAQPLAQEEPESENLDSVAFVKSLLKKLAPKPHVSVEPAELPVTYVDWSPAPTGGHHVLKRTHNLGSAVLHEGPEDRVLFVLNHYIEAVKFAVSFGKLKVSELENLDTGERLAVKNGKVSVDIDRKSASIYRVIV